MAVSNDWVKRTATDMMYTHLDEVVNRTWNKWGRAKNFEDHVTNAIFGLGGEAGEVLDLHKKSFFHAPKDRREELKLELGDVVYYWLKLVDLYGFTIEEILAANKAKLFDRHDIKEGK